MKIQKVNHLRNHTQKTFIEKFIIRQNELTQLFEEIKKNYRQNPPQHYLIQGFRGIGKTTFLLRLYYEMRNDEKLKKYIIPIIFSEELYAVRSLDKLWVQIAKHLEQADSPFENIVSETFTSYEHSKPEEKAFEILIEKLNKIKKQIVLFIDNFGDMLGKFGEREQQRFREILITTPYLRIIGATTELPETTFHYSNPFYEFFKTIHLEGLTSTETQSLFTGLDRVYKNPKIKGVVKKFPGLIESFRRLTNGNTRTMILLYEILSKTTDEDSTFDLENLLERMTPAYKQIMDNLSAQQQEITHVIAIHWDAINVKEISRQTRIDSNAISSQLKQLEKSKIIERETTSTKNHLYRINERFFNIWYVMRYGMEKDKVRIIWFVQFLENWCNQEKSDINILLKSSTKYNSQHTFKKAFQYFSHKKEPAKALVLIRTSYEKDKNNHTALLYIIILLWNNDISEALEIATEISNKIKEENIELFKLFLILLIAKKQYNYAINIFNDNLQNYKDRFKPIYFALMHFVKDKYPDEFRKPGEDMKEIIAEIIKKIELFEIEYQ